MSLDGEIWGFFGFGDFSGAFFFRSTTLFPIMTGFSSLMGGLILLAGAADTEVDAFFSTPSDTVGFGADFGFNGG